jgi:hypothetical protein
MVLHRGTSRKEELKTLISLPLLSVLQQQLPVRLPYSPTLRNFYNLFYPRALTLHFPVGDRSLTCACVVWAVMLLPCTFLLGTGVWLAHAWFERSCSYLALFCWGQEFDLRTHGFSGPEPLPCTFLSGTGVLTCACVVWAVWPLPCTFLSGTGDLLMRGFSGPEPLPCTFLSGTGVWLAHAVWAVRPLDCPPSPRWTATRRRSQWRLGTVAALCRCSCSQISHWSGPRLS